MKVKEGYFMLFGHIENLLSNIGIGNFNMVILMLTAFKILILKPWGRQWYRCHRCTLSPAGGALYSGLTRIFSYFPEFFVDVNGLYHTGLLIFADYFGLA